MGSVTRKSSFRGERSITLTPTFPTGSLRGKRKKIDDRKIRRFLTSLLLPPSSRLDATSLSLSFLDPSSSSLARSLASLCYLRSGSITEYFEETQMKALIHPLKPETREIYFGFYNYSVSIKQKVSPWDNINALCIFVVCSVFSPWLGPFSRL